MSESYEALVGGKLKLKGRALAVPLPAKKKKRKKKHKKKEKKRKRERERAGNEEAEVLTLRDTMEPDERKTAGDSGDLTMEEKEAERVGLQLGLTPAQIAFERNRKRRVKATLKESVKLSYREKVEKNNQYLASLPDHFDIPKVASAGNG